MNLEDDILIEQFLRNELSENERQEFLERVKNDTNFRETYLLEKQLFESLNENDWSFAENVNEKELNDYAAVFKSDEIQNLKKVLKNTKDKQNDGKQMNRGRIISLFSSLAAAVVIAIFVFKPMLSPSVLDTNSLYINYSDFNNLPSFTERGIDDTNNLLVDGEKFFKQKKYKEAVVIFDEFLKENKSESGAYIYNALAQTELKNFDEAIEILDVLKKSDLIDAEKAYWYMSLVYLKSNQTEKAEKELQYIINNSLFNKPKAEELISKLQ
ncbi:tetratricopeptide repeat protein [Tenacibaculum sp. MEBiC06402]|uniref:tetratricopeptide repeat protein n=1 Tax=unclassified Tenacibaculum TaxID=2635139 RepID=UPI003B99628B